jgi:hypothetical protein
MKCLKDMHNNVNEYKKYHRKENDQEEASGVTSIFSAQAKTHSKNQ